MRATSSAQGSAELSFQAYSSHDTGTAPNYIGDVSLVFRYLQPGFAVISGSLNGGVFAPSIRRGQSYFSVDDFRWLGGKIGTTVGDFDVSMSPLFQPSSGLVIANSALSGVLTSFAIGNQRYAFFRGSSYFLEGARIPFRSGSGQNVVGTIATWNLTPGLNLSARLLHVGSKQQSRLESLLSPLTQDLQGTVTGSLQATWKMNDALELFGEGALSSSQFKPGVEHISIQPFSGSAGGSFRLGRFSMKGAAVLDSANYLPLVGTYSNGRSGANGEIRVSPWESLRLFASGSSFNNLISLAAPEQTEHTISATAGFQTNFGKTTISGNYSLLTASSISTLGQNGQDYRTSLSSVTVGRQLGRHMLRATWEDIALTTNSERKVQQTADFEDGVHVSSAIIGAALRYETTKANAQPANIAARFFWNWSWRRFSTFGSFEAGSDLAARSILTTSGNSTSTFGVETLLGRHWTFKTDALRTRLMINLNAENALLLAQQGIGPTTILNSNHWTIYAAVTRQLSWRGGNSLAHVADIARGALPQLGSIEGYILIDHGDHTAPGASGIPLILDNGRTAQTGAGGHFRFGDVAEGIHAVAIDVGRLAVDFNPPARSESTILVVPRRVTRADFTVEHVEALAGWVHPGKDAYPENIIIKLDGGGEYTSADASGHFQFSNVPEGPHKIYIELGSVPKDESIQGPSECSVVLKDGVQVAPQFELVYTPVKKPVRRIFLGNKPPE